MSKPIATKLIWDIGTAYELFISLYPFSDHIDQNTGQLLISLDRKLKKY
jgi:hypothetical protein